MKKLLIVFLIFLNLIVNAQYFQTGQDPASINWRQINTENFQLIYPDYYENQAQILAQKLETIYEYGSYSLAFKPNKISIILHTQTVKSNGMVAYAPKRSEFYTTPNQGLYSQDWLERLAVHEFRHVVQIDKINDELPKIIKILLGEQGTALVFGAYLPWWFIEGDAVVTETALGNYGRGRFPSFLIEHRAQLVEKGVYSYDKAYLGSYKNYVPNHYQLGYYMVGNSRKRYGSQLWEKVLKRVGEKPLSVTPFNKALKLETGLNKVQLYHSIFDSLAVEWKKEDANYEFPPSTIISREHKTYTNYTYNFWHRNDELISYKTALNRIPSLVKVNKNGKEKKVYHPGFIFDQSLNFRKEWAVWSEQIPDLRWSHSGRSKICVLNIESKKKLSFMPEFKAFAPSISKDLKKVVLVEADFSSNYYLSVYDIFSGELLSRVHTTENNYFFSPDWINNNEVVAVILTSQGKRLAKFDLGTGNHEILFDEDLGELKSLRVKNDQLFFIGGVSGKNALYKYSFASKQITQIFEPRFSAEFPAISSNGEIAISNYTGNGFNLLKIDSAREIPISEVRRENYPLAITLASQELGKPDFSNYTSKKYTSKKYSKSAHLFNFHSWAPLFVDVDSYEFKPGVSVMSQNKLGTATTVLGYKWDTAEETGQLYGNYTYKGWYPVFDIEASYGNRASSYFLITEHNNTSGQVMSRDTSIQRYTWKETTLSGNISLPLNLSQGIYYRLLQPEFKYELNRFKKNNSTPDGFPDGNYQSLFYRLYYHQLLRQSQQDVYPNFGVVFDASYRHSPNGTKGQGNLAAGQAYLYLPGFMLNHGIKIYAGGQDKQAGEVFRFSDAIRFPRGWSKIETNELYTFAADYKLPLINPDWSLGGLAYIRRINASLFADYSKLKGNYYENGEIAGTYKTDISSYGVELVGDVNFLRFYAPVKIGIRSSYLPEAEEFVFNFLFSIDFNSL